MSTTRLIRRSENQALLKDGIIEGYAIVFNQRTNVANLFYEEIDPNALINADVSDIKFFINHNDDMLPLARHRAEGQSTMDINIDEKGLFISAKLDIENNAKAKELFSAVDRGDIEDMSFAFGLYSIGEEWSDIQSTMPIRRITKIDKVFEVSAVNDGAYPQTSINARAAPIDIEAFKQAKQNVQERNLKLEKQKYIFLRRYKNGIR